MYLSSFMAENCSKVTTFYDKTKIFLVYECDVKEKEKKIQ